MPFISKMGNCKSKKPQKEPDKFFERARWIEQKNEETKKKMANSMLKRSAAKEAPINPATMLNAPARGNSPLPAPAQVRSYDEEALDRMRDELNHNSNVFLLNNILLSVQFFENYEREVQLLKNNPISERQQVMDAAMVRRHKHVFIADRLLECVQEYVCFQKSRDIVQPLAAPRLYIIYDNVEASEPGDTSDYCAVLDAPFYKLRIEESNAPGYVTLKKIEVLESSLSKEADLIKTCQSDSDDSIYTDSEKESNGSDVSLNFAGVRELTVRHEVLERSSSPERYIKNTPRKSVNISSNQKSKNVYKSRNNEAQDKPRKSILKTSTFEKQSDVKVRSSLANINSAEDTETSGYRSNSSRQTESSETESDYGYTTIIESTTPKKIVLKNQSKDSASSGILPEECWISVNEKAFDWSDDEEEEDTASKLSLTRTLYKTHQYLNSITFMNDFVDDFAVGLGSGLEFKQDEIKKALTQGASIYCDSVRNGSATTYEVLPALLAAWPNAANQWIIRERKIITNPRTNFSYQWPTKYMVSKAIDFGCLLVPLGFRSKRGLNPNQRLQWKLIFPAGERYLESCLSHSHMRCYLFMLTLHKAFIENDASKIGIDASHIKNHLFWQCEDDYAKWPEDRLGESLLLFLKSFYCQFRRSRFPNYFIENCNEFENIPSTLLRHVQKQLAEILEAPVMHLLYALNKIKYMKKDFYPAFNARRLYDILTCKNPLRIMNPYLSVHSAPLKNESSDSEEENTSSIWDSKAKHNDKNYQWNKEMQRQMKERRRAHSNTKKPREKEKERVYKEMNKNIILPHKMDIERRRLVLEFFISRFIAMARSSEKFDAIRQAVIYLEQARRLSILLRDEPAGETSAYEYDHIIRDKLADCQRKLASQVGYKVSVREKDRSVHAHVTRKQRPRFEHIVNNRDSPTEQPPTPPFTFVDVHVEQAKARDNKQLAEVNDSEHSKL